MAIIWIENNILFAFLSIFILPSLFRYGYVFSNGDHVLLCIVTFFKPRICRILRIEVEDGVMIMWTRVNLVVYSKESHLYRVLIFSFLQKQQRWAWLFSIREYWTHLSYYVGLSAIIIFCNAVPLSVFGSFVFDFRYLKNEMVLMQLFLFVLIYQKFVNKLFHIERNYLISKLLFWSSKFSFVSRLFTSTTVNVIQESFSIYRRILVEDNFWLDSAHLAVTISIQHIF